ERLQERGAFDRNLHGVFWHVLAPAGRRATEWPATLPERQRRRKGTRAGNHSLAPCSAASGAA
ncbi:MAG: hypothetical protein J0I67_12510, partial [Bosea sp.]|nr:hypothetical protein [Bosea sp. (in: a-proteobacteria)]